MAVTVSEAIPAAAHGAQPPMPALEVVVDRGPLRLRLLSLGAAIRSLEVPGPDGALGHVHLQLPHVDDYADQALNPHLGATIGRYANRIGDARFTLDGVEHRTDPNRPPTTLHGGTWGFDRVVWDVADVESRPGEPDRVTFRLRSADGDMGFPGEMVAEATYEVGDAHLAFHYRATSDRDTVVSLTNHGYWNLAGEGTVADHTLAVAASRVLAIGPELIPTGGVDDVAGSPLDLRSPTTLGPAIAALSSGGFDHCYVLDGADLAHDAPRQPVRRAAVLAGGGRWMTVSTDCPGLQVYTGNALKPPFVPHGSVSLETQRMPDAPNHPHLGPCALRAGEAYESTTVLEFGVGAPPGLSS